MEANGEGEVRLLKAMLTQSLQESLDELLVKRRWYGDRDDFTVTLQDQPLITDVSSVAVGLNSAAFPLYSAPFCIP
ncbi:hypothetical protein F2P81_024367 [Scophthalmus maximus]|uniref:Uncharacterized protein n=1 Tax=Scophthalmus maximus TaxID=52904 RepID=A0A6A4RTW1_SCOMX|nr:hypothetical protein F2P81_024367 [Scophthalmus maximus]